MLALGKTSNKPKASHWPSNRKTWQWTGFSNARIFSKIAFNEFLVIIKPMEKLTEHAKDKKHGGNVVEHRSEGIKNAEM